jgi:hypothetical protein
MERGQMNRPKAMKDGIPPGRLNDIKVAAAKRAATPKKAVAKKAAPAKTTTYKVKPRTTADGAERKAVAAKKAAGGRSYTYSNQGGRRSADANKPLVDARPKYPIPGRNSTPMGRPTAGGSGVNARPARPVYDSRYRRMPTNGRSPMQMTRPMLPRTY